MANTITEQATGVMPDRATPGLSWTVRQIKVTRDTAADITVRTPASGKRVALLGVVGLDATAATLTIKSASTTIAPLEFTTNQGLVGGPKIPLLTATDEALVVAFSANVDGVVFQVADCETQLPSL